MLLEYCPIASYAPGYFTGMYSDHSIYFPMKFMTIMIISNHQDVIPVALGGFPNLGKNLLLFLDFALYFWWIFLGGISGI